MDLEDLPKPKPQIVVGDNLERLSLAELAQRIEELESEIARVRTTIAAKRDGKNAADALFRS